MRPKFQINIWDVDVKFIYSEKATKFCKISTLLLTVCTVVKSKVEISQNFMAFSEYTNFNFQNGSLKFFFSFIFSFTFLNMKLLSEVAPRLLLIQIQIHALCISLGGILGLIGVGLLLFCKSCEEIRLKLFFWRLFEHFIRQNVNFTYLMWNYYESVFHLEHNV